jgi:hypothetical protein
MKERSPNGSMWFSKKAEVQGKEHMNYRGQPVEARRAGINCLYRKNSVDGTDKVCQANLLGKS